MTKLESFCGYRSHILRGLGCWVSGSSYRSQCRYKTYESVNQYAILGFTIMKLCESFLVKGWRKRMYNMYYKHLSIVEKSSRFPVTTNKI